MESRSTKSSRSNAKKAEPPHAPCLASKAQQASKRRNKRRAASPLPRKVGFNGSPSQYAPRHLTPLDGTLILSEPGTVALQPAGGQGRAAASFQAKSPRRRVPAKTSWGSRRPSPPLLETPNRPPSNPSLCREEKHHLAAVALSYLASPAPPTGRPCACASPSPSSPRSPRWCALPRAPRPTTDGALKSRTSLLRSRTRTLTYPCAPNAAETVRKHWHA